MDDPELIERLGEGAHGYFAGGAGDEITLRDNEASWSRLALLPRVLVDVGSATSRCRCSATTCRTR